ncbi:VWA domain-containing protein [Coraliomargarita algicola]|uniref:VWA domain-containing protein n=1 Tax=Coraliomargarita algicola TaxID=3092156 RepID=A0ABZ0RPN3_9BACT|nr:VWA domain-containing protein [Coraliomargarita sp. J2-16]WPJ97482.1 VWA domain-containing protein [Coraliomargarita sp. J2-16]
MSFQEPVWLTLIPILLLIFGGMLTYGFRRRDALLSRFAAGRLLEQLTEQASLSRTWIKAACILLAVVAIGVALARPQFGVEWSERKARGLDIVFVLDSSKSMLATDLRPTRLDRAKLAIIDLVERLESDRIGLVAFAGQAFLQTPPTLDYSAFRESLDAVDPSIMTSGGSDLGNAIKEAAEAFPTESNVKVVVLLTDGEDLGGHASQAATAAREDGIQIFAIGIGTPEGEYLKIRNSQGIEEFVRDAEGQPVRSQLDESTLQQIAKATGGSYSRLSNASLDQLYRSVIATLPREERESELQEIHIERFQWALSTAICLLVLEILIRRRRSAAIHASLLLLAVFVASPTESQAQSEPTDEAQALSETTLPNDARSSYNAAYEALSSGDYETAIQGYEAAIAQSDDFTLQRDALYNLGYATYQQGRGSYETGDPQTALEQIQKAEALYKSAQEIDPNDTSIQQDLEKVTAVREVIEKLIEEQKKQDPQQQDQSQDSDNSDQQNEQSPENQNSDQNQEQNQNESQQGDEQEQNKGEQSEDSKQDQQGDQSQQNEQGESGDQSSEEQQQAQNGAESEDDHSQNSASESETQESTQDPVDDIPQPAEENEATSESQQPSGMPEPSEDQTSPEAPGAASGTISEPVEGMSPEEAAALLDSLQGKETLLPFIDQSRRGRQSDLRDW